MADDHDNTISQVHGLLRFNNGKQRMRKGTEVRVANTLFLLCRIIAPPGSQHRQDHSTANHRHSSSASSSAARRCVNEPQPAHLWQALVCVIDGTTMSTVQTASDWATTERSGTQYPRATDDSDILATSQTPADLTPYWEARYVALDKETDMLVHAIEGTEKPHRRHRPTTTK
ncbi:hypothetical protein V492_06298 [Pseudogymnoascus sp. VKM F-4246]|nr:hypothetical protein V492_06298 [Pseudogymnoascus sp. VKM F-4246]